MLMSNLVALMRVRTLPISVAVIAVGNALAYYHGHWRFSVFFLSLVTALSLQILANIANDYGDGVRGTDAHRSPAAPRRLTGSGAISHEQSLRYVIAAVAVTMVFGSLLLWVSAYSVDQLVLFLLLGVLSILAALFYTIGRYAYGYLGLGEVSVFVFFGLIGVCGSYALQANGIHWMILPPACGAGLLAAAVLHVDNIRDITSDRHCAKRTVAVRLGFGNSRHFHLLLLLLALFCYLPFALFGTFLSALWVLLLPLLGAHARNVFQAGSEARVGEELKTSVGLMFGINVCFAVGLLIAAWTVSPALSL